MRRGWGALCLLVHRHASTSMLLVLGGAEKYKGKQAPKASPRLFTRYQHRGCSSLSGLLRGLGVCRL